jgi:hypothetical protein
MPSKKITVLGKKIPRGQEMATGKKWRLVTPGKKGFKAALLKKLDVGGQRLAIFRVLPFDASE